MNPKLEAEVDEPSFQDQVAGSLGAQPILARGLARGYGDVNLNSKVVSTLKLNRILDFDVVAGVIECEAGTSLAQIIDFILPKGFFLPVTPGTKFITVGGAIAADVHGKNHHVEGCFSEHVEWFDILNENGNTIRCSSTENSELYYQTIGGMGLTGIILSARFRLKKVETAFIKQTSIKCRNLSEVMEAFNTHQNATYSVAWLDVSQQSSSLGRSVLLLGEHALKTDLPSRYSDPLALPKKKAISLPFTFPSFTINGLSIKLFNLLFYLKNGNSKDRLIDLDSYFYPLDSVHYWNRVYGKNGFTQYQFVLPLQASEAGLTEILKYISQSGYSSFLTVLKLFGKSHPKAVRSFPMEGYTLAIDFKIDSGIQSFVDGLDDLVEKHGGHIYLVKDTFSRLGKRHLPEFEPLSEAFNSLLIERLKK